MSHEGTYRPGVKPAYYFRYKDYAGRLLALALFVPGIVLTGILMLLVKATSPGPAIYRQQRVGKHGKIFTMLKIRTMRCDAEAAGAQWTQLKDPRITRLGAALRSLHLDELPQLWNVLRGDMALIGPRPERPEFTQILAHEIPGYLDRLVVRPGITGLAQINLPPDLDLDDVRRKLQLDLEYIREGSALLDLRMLLSTLLRMFGLRSEYALWILGLKRKVVLSECDASIRIGALRPHNRPTESRPAGVNGHISAGESLLDSSHVDIAKDDVAAR